MPKENTIPELLTRKILEDYGINYEPQFSLSKYFYDFFLPDYGLLIEVHGTFFHANPLVYHPEDRSYIQIKNFRRDRRKLQVARKHNLRIMYIWESDLQNRFKKVAAELKEYLNVEFDHRHLLEDIFPPYKRFYNLPKKDRPVILVDNGKLENTKIHNESPDPPETAQEIISV